jgi:steroid 5-alpha reductase family enzyme
VTGYTLILLGTLLVAGLMAILWWIQTRTANAGIVDAGWAGGIGLLAAFYALAGGGYWLRSLLLAGMVGFWSIRLTSYLMFNRVIGHPEEGRYVALRQKWKTGINQKFFIFFEFQAILAAFLAMPFLYAARNTSPQISTLEWSAVALWVIAMAGEAIADAQLKSFKDNKANKGKTCQAGLWHFSRHPNYFFEFLIWMAWAFFAWDSPHGPWGFISPMAILYFVLFLTGIPPTERQALRTRGDEYRRYQQTTSGFVPWFPKKPSN